MEVKEENNRYLDNCPQNPHGVYSYIMLDKFAQFFTLAGAFHK